MNKKQYIHYTDINRELLDTIKVGNLIKINDWKKPMRVKAVSENFFVMTQKIFGSPLCVEYENLYEFENEESNEAYLQEFEEDRVHISERSGIAIYDLYVKAD